MNERLRRNTLPSSYVYDPREGRQVPGDSLLPKMPKHRLEQTAFLEGVQWLIDHLVTYKADMPNIKEVAFEEAKKRYPDYD